MKDIKFMTAAVTATIGTLRGFALKAVYSLYGGD